VEIILFAKKKKIEGFLKPILLDTVMNTTGSVKYLGVILDAPGGSMKKEGSVQPNLPFGHVRELLERPVVLNRKFCSDFTEA
jgi:hypothetical protein